MVQKLNISICAIHQPNFFPWLGYFNKIYRSDKFVLLDEVLKSGHSGWVNRVSIVAGGHPMWITGPMVHSKESQILNQIKLDYTTKWREKIEKTLIYNYRKAKYYEEAADYIFSFLQLKYDNLMELNKQFIRETCKKLNISTSILEQSALGTKESSTRLLIEITKKVQCSAYMCGGGADGYQEDELFEENGIGLYYQKFIHPVYPQFKNEFIKGQSIIDALFHCGIAGTECLIKGEEIGHT